MALKGATTPDLLTLVILFRVGTLVATWLNDIFERKLAEKRRFSISISEEDIKQDAKRNHHTPLSLFTNAVPTVTQWATCFVTTTTYDESIVVSVFANNEEQTNKYFDFGRDVQKVVVDKCTTHHICKDSPLFDSVPVHCKNIIINCATSVGTAAASGNITITVRDCNNNNHDITQKNVIYLPECSKNIISTSKWSNNESDNYCILSRGEGSTLYSSRATIIFIKLYHTQYR